MRNIIKPIVVAVSLAIISTVELLMIDKDYLNKESFIDPGGFTSENFTPTDYDKQILQDKDPDFRVFNYAPGWTYESRTSYFHKSIGGYHPAKLRLYQDIIDRYLSGPHNQNVLNMLNMKYRIVNDEQNQRVFVDTNHNALGSCWLVKHVSIVNDNVQELQSIGNANLKDTAFVQKSFVNNVAQPQWDSAASIKLAKFDNDTMEYAFSANAPQFAVFSEVFYPYGWNAYIDGKKVDYCRTNYILRGLSIPAGKHEVKFIFEPSTYKKGLKIAFASSFLVLIFFVGGIFMQWWTNRKKNAPVA